MITSPLLVGGEVAAGQPFENGINHAIGKVPPQCGGGANELLSELTVAKITRRSCTTGYNYTTLRELN